MSGSESPSPELLNLILAEYSALRSEMDSRSKKQFLSITFSIASVGAILGAVMTNLSDHYLLIAVIPWISTISGLFWLDHDKAIANIGTYIRCSIEAKANRLYFYKKDADSDRIVGLEWQQYGHECMQKDFPYGYMFYSIILLYFIAPSLISLIFVYKYHSVSSNPSSEPIVYTFILCDVVLVLSFFVIWLKAVLRR